MAIHKEGFPGGSDSKESILKSEAPIFHSQIAN